MTEIGIPIRQYRWWEHVVDQDGNPVHILTFSDLEKMWAEEYDEVIDEMAVELSRRLNETLTAMGKEPPAMSACKLPKFFEISATFSEFVRLYNRAVSGSNPKKRQLNGNHYKTLPAMRGN